MSQLLLCLITCFTLAPRLRASLFPVPKNDGDLERFVSRPDLRPPKFRVNLVEKSAISEGYWFVAPYGDLIRRPVSRLHQTNQIGPHIYDNHGRLVWSGAGLFPGRNVFDFKVVNDRTTPHMSFLLGAQEHEKEHIGGAGVIIDNSYQVQNYVHTKHGMGTTNMHEFTVLHGGRTALTLIHEKRFFESDQPNFHNWIIDIGFVEIDVESGEILFEWWAADHIHPAQSTVAMPSIQMGQRQAWDCYHINSVDKDRNGDYLVSARHTNTIYKISGVDHSVIWQLGGRNSSFILQDFNFSSQHHARFRSHNKTTTIITFLNNASDGILRTANVSSAFVVALDTSQIPMTATVVNRFDRPDKKLTNLRGNVQVLPNSNIAVGWSANSYITEASNDGRLVLEANFASERFVTYRSYKFNFTGNPLQLPDLVCYAYGTSMHLMTTVCYVSWNGATEIQTWRFYSTDPRINNGTGTLLGNVARQGFETMFMAAGYAPFVFAEALDSHGQSLRNSSIIITNKPKGNNTEKPADNSTLNVDDGGNASMSRNLLKLKHVIPRKIPTLWSIVFVMIGVLGSLTLLSASKVFRRCRSIRRHEQKGYIRVTNEV